MAKIDDIEFEKLEREAWHKELTAALSDIAKSEGVDVSPVLMEAVIALRDIAGKDFNASTEVSIANALQIQWDGMPQPDLTPVASALNFDLVIAAIKTLKRPAFPKSFRVDRNSEGLIERIVAE